MLKVLVPNYSSTVPQCKTDTPARLCATKNQSNASHLYPVLQRIALVQIFAILLSQGLFCATTTPPTKYPIHIYAKQTVLREVQHQCVLQSTTSTFIKYRTRLQKHKTTKYKFNSIQYCKVAAGLHEEALLQSHFVSHRTTPALLLKNGMIAEAQVVLFNRTFTGWE